MSNSLKDLGLTLEDLKVVAKAIYSFKEVLKTLETLKTMKVCLKMSY